MSNITKFDIARAKKEAALQSEAYHEHDDCIRIAYEWMDAQSFIKRSRSKQDPIKHLIERWAGRYVSQSDVEIAAHLHSQIEGKYPFFNFSSKLIEPAKSRLSDIGEAFTQDHYCKQHKPTLYSKAE